MSIRTTTVLFEDKKNDTKRLNAVDVHRWSAMSKTMRVVRSVDLETKEVNITHPISSEKKNERLYHFETECGYIIECSLDTEIWNGTVWVKAENLEVGDVIWVNGEPCERYKDRDWLEEWYVKRHKTQQEIADMCSTDDFPVSARTIRFWVKRYDLGRGDSGAVFGKDNPNYKGDNVSNHTLYAKMRENFVKTNVCSICGRSGNTDIHHLDHDLLNYDKDNFIEICEGCHIQIHRGNIVKHTRPTKITVKRIAGVDDCVNIKTECGNYVADGYIIRGE